MFAMQSLGPLEPQEPVGFLAPPCFLTDGGIDAGEETATDEPAAWKEGDHVGQRGWVELVHRDQGRRARWNQDGEVVPRHRVGQLLAKYARR